MLGVPGTFPVAPLNGVMVSCFLTPVDAVAVHVPARRCATRSRTSSASTSSTVTEFRTEDKVDLLRQIYEMTDKRFKLADTC